MRKTLSILTLVLLCGMPAASETTRTLNDSVSTAGIGTVILEAGVGDVEVATSDRETVEIEVVLKPRRGGFFSSMKHAEREVEEASLKVDTSGDRIRLRIDSSSDDRRFEERWTLTMPARMAIDLDLGVGDVELRGLNGGVKIDSGVGDLLIEVGGGDVAIDLGVGDVTVRGPARAFRSAECSGGVGDARLKVQGERISGDGFVGHSASWSGGGEHRLVVDVGVGDATVTLD